MSFTNKPMALPWDPPSAWPLPTFLLAIMSQNSSIHLVNFLCTTVTWMTTFIVFDNEQECDLFLEQLNSLHFYLQFTFKTECNQSLPFLDFMVENSPPKFVISVYRKPTFTGQYICWNYFSPQKRKTNLILTVTHKTLVYLFTGKITRWIRYNHLNTIERWLSWTHY